MRLWGPETAPALVLLHGIRDASATFQFFVDSVKGSWRIIAPDWRGHGQSRSGTENCWFHEYVADLNCLTDMLVPSESFDLVGHSLGGNVASMFAGIQPSRIAHVVSLDAFGMHGLHPPAVPRMLSRWIQSARGSHPHKLYSTIDELAARLIARNRRLTLDKALYLAENLSRLHPSGGVVWQFDLADARSTPSLHSLEEYMACWRQITAAKLWIKAAEPVKGSVASDPAALARVRECIGSRSLLELPGTGHNLHHDAPSLVANAVEQFPREVA